jgi:hypothetical protein
LARNHACGISQRKTPATQEAARVPPESLFWTKRGSDDRQLMDDANGSFAASARSVRRCQPNAPRNGRSPLLFLSKMSSVGEGGRIGRCSGPMWDGCRLIWSLLIGLFRSRAALCGRPAAYSAEETWLQCPRPVGIGRPLSTVSGCSVCADDRQARDHRSVDRAGFRTYWRWRRLREAARLEATYTSVRSRDGQFRTSLRVHFRGGCIDGVCRSANSAHRTHRSAIFFHVAALAGSRVNLAIR